MRDDTIPSSSQLHHHKGEWVGIRPAGGSVAPSRERRLHCSLQGDGVPRVGVAGGDDGSVIDVAAAQSVGNVDSEGVTTVDQLSLTGVWECPPDRHGYRGDGMALF